MSKFTRLIALCALGLTVVSISACNKPAEPTPPPTTSAPATKPGGDPPSGYVRTKAGPVGAPGQPGRGGK